MANTFKFGNKKWATKEGSVLAYNDENGNFKPLPFDFTRASSATRVNENGLIEVVGSNEPRIDYLNNADGHLLLEPSRTNLMPYSEDTTGFSHYNYGGGLLVDTYGYPSPDGQNNASRLVYTNSSAGSGGALLTQNLTLNATGTYTLSLWIKSISGLNKIRVSPKDTGSQGTIGEVFTITDEWQRYTHTFTNDGGTSRGFQFRISETEDSGDRTFDVWGMQMEEGSYATSYIPTSGSAVTRAVEVCNDAGNSNVFNDSEGVFFVEMAALANDGTNRIFGISGASGFNDSVVIRYNGAADNNILAQVRLGGTYQCGLDYFPSDATEFSKVAFKYKANDFELYAAGALQEADTSGGTITGLEDFGFSFVGGNQFYGKIKSVKIYNTALTDAELIALTS